MTIGERIRKVRKGKGLTQKALGDLLGVTQATVGQYENNVNPPKLGTLQRIADALGVQLAELYGFTPEQIEREQRHYEDVHKVTTALDASYDAVVSAFNGISDDSIMEYLDSIIRDDLTRKGRILTLQKAYELSTTEGCGIFAPKPKKGTTNEKEG